VPTSVVESVRVGVEQNALVVGLGVKIRQDQMGEVFPKPVAEKAAQSVIHADEGAYARAVDGTKIDGLR
jgi:hypothetical protein